MDASIFPLEPSATDAQGAIRDEFAFFGDWAERYQYLTDRSPFIGLVNDTYVAQLPLLQSA